MEVNAYISREANVLQKFCSLNSNKSAHGISSRVRLYTRSQLTPDNQLMIWNRNYGENRFNTPKNGMPAYALSSFSRGSLFKYPSISNTTEWTARKLAVASSVYRN
ncbi:hypothetical protein ACTXT7_012320 [Hymenolepis weldensis]